MNTQSVFLLHYNSRKVSQMWNVDNLLMWIVLVWQNTTHRKERIQALLSIKNIQKKLDGFFISIFTSGN